MQRPSRKQRWLLLTTAAGFVMALLATRGCGSDEPGGLEPGQDAGLLDVMSDERSTFLDATEAADTPDDAADASCPPWPIPAGVPDGWLEYPVFRCMHRFYYPPTTEHLPEPLQWENCPDLGPDSYVCRQLMLDRPGKDPAYVSGIPFGCVDGGRVVLQAILLYPSSGDGGTLLGLVVEADGPARQALWLTFQSSYDAAFWLSHTGVAPGKSAWYLLRLERRTIVEYARMAGDDTDLRPPILLQHPPDDPEGGLIHPGTYYYSVGGGSLRIRGWDETDYGVAAYDSVTPVWTGPYVLWDTDSLVRVEIWRWAEQDGSVRLIGFPGDDSKGAGNIGTDGQDLAWVQGEGRQPTDQGFPTRSIMTSPFTIDPADVQPRRLRSWLPEFIGTGLRPPAVGCGYAALRLVPNHDDAHLLIVRLADGVSWQLHCPADRRWLWGSPVAVSCEEVFVASGPGGQGQIRRIRLDSLGPGMPPD